MMTFMIQQGAGPDWARRGGEVRKPQGLLQVSLQREQAHGRSLPGTFGAMYQLHWSAGFSRVDTLTACGILLLRRLGGGCQAVNQHVGTPGLAPPGRASTLPLGTDRAALDLLLTCGGA